MPEDFEVPDGETQEIDDGGCICFGCAHSMVFICEMQEQYIDTSSGKPRPSLRWGGEQHRVVCLAGHAPLPIGDRNKIHVLHCTHFEPGGAKTLRAPGEPSDGTVQ